MKTLVALLAALLVLVGPVAAQDPEPQPPADDTAAEPEPASSDPAADPASSNSSAQGTEPQPSTDSTQNADATQDTTAMTCPIVKSHVGDPTVPRSQWVIIDPNGCVQKIVYRVLSWPPTTFVLRRI